MSLYDIEKKEQTFRGKSIPHDELGLKPKVDNYDIVRKENLYYTLSGFNQVLVYDF